MHQFITLKKDDPQFEQYLLGTLPDNQIAYPVKSFSVMTDAERVTFRVEEKAPFSVLKFISGFIKNTQWGFLLYLLAPLLLLLSTFSLSSIDLLQSGLIFVALVLCYCALILFNAYFDHYKGVDRLSSEVGVVSSPIQKSVITARNSYRLAWVYLLTSGALGFWLLRTNWVNFSLICGFCSLAIIGYSNHRIDLKGRALGELFAIIGFGPLLFWGVQQALQMPWRPEYYFISGVMGLSSAVYLLARQLLHLMTDSKAGVKTLAVRLGFDRSLKFLHMSFVFSSFSLLTLSVLVDGVLAFGILPVFGWGYLKISRKLKSIKSPLSSELQPLPGKIAVFHFFIYLAMSCISGMGHW